jgi:hypothetical protein
MSRLFGTVCPLAVVVATIDQAVTPSRSGVGENSYPFAAQIPYLQASPFAYPAAFTIGNLVFNNAGSSQANWQLRGWFEW